LCTSIVRFTTFFGTNALTDGTWASVDLTIWTIVESDVYLIASCLPTFRPLIHKITGKDASYQSSYVNSVRIGGTGSTFSTSKSNSNMRTLGEGHKNYENPGTTIGFVQIKDPETKPIVHKAGQIHVQKEFQITVLE
jgi:hypothetical protein